MSFIVLCRRCFGRPAQVLHYSFYTLIWLVYFLAAMPTVQPILLSKFFTGQHTPHATPHHTHCAALLTRHNMALHFQLSSLHGSLLLPPDTTNLSTLYLLYDLYGGRATSLSVNTRVLLGTTPSPRPISQSTHALCWASLTCCEAHPPCHPRNLQLNRKDTDE